MHVEVAEVEARLLRTRDPHHAVGVGLVVHAESAGFVDEARELLDVRVVDPGVFGVRDDDARRAIGERGLQCVDLGVAIRARVELDDLVAGRVRTRLVTGVREDRRDDLVALLTLAARAMVRAHDRGVGVDSR